MNHRMPRSPRGCKARRDTFVRAPNVSSLAATPLRALLPGASALEWLAYLTARGDR